jgi:hypothetical protein
MSQAEQRDVEKDLLISGLMIARKSRMDDASKVRWINEMVDGYIAKIRAINEAT